MTLKSLIENIAKLAIEQKCINYSMGGSSIYQLNPQKVDAYPVLFLSPTGEHLVSDNYTTYEISLYYLDRLTEDSANDIDIYSASIEQLKNIIRGIADMEGVLKVADDYRITNFSDTESFDDRLAGGYTTIEVTVKNEDTCFIV